MHRCPRRGEMVTPTGYPTSDTYESDDTCSYCGSMHPDVFMTRLEGGDIELGPTDKSYKIYVTNKGGRSLPYTKFYFQHLSNNQRLQFIQLLNGKKVHIGYPGHFYTTPFFITYAKPTC